MPLEISIHVSEVIPEAKENQQLLLPQFHASITWNLKTHRGFRKREDKTLQALPNRRYPLLCQAVLSFFFPQICQGSRTRVSKAKEKASSEGEEGAFLREEQILPRPLLLLVCERDVDDAHELRLDDVPLAGLVVLHQHLVGPLGPHGHDQPPARLQLLQQLHRDTPQETQTIVKVRTEEKLPVVPSFSQGHPAEPALPPWGRWLRPLPHGSHRKEPPRGIPACRPQLHREEKTLAVVTAQRITTNCKDFEEQSQGKIPGIAGSSPTSFTRPELSSVGSSSWTFRMDSCTSSLMCSTPTAFPVGPICKEHQSNS